MWRKIQAIVGALCIVLYAGVAFWAGFSVYRSLNRHKTLAEKEFKDLADFAASAGVLGFTGQNFRDDIESALVQAQTLQAAIFTGPDGQLVALEKTRGALVWDGDIPRFSGNFVLFRKPFGTTLRVEGLPSARIGAVASSVDYDALVRVLRTGLFAVMLASAAAFGTLMLGFVPALNRDASPDSAPDDEADDEADGSIYDDTVAWPEEGGGDAAETAAGTAATSGADEPEDAAGEAAEAALFAESPAVLDSEAALFSEPAPDEKPDILADDALFDGVDGPDSVEEALPSSLPDLDDLLEPFGEIPADAEDEPAPEDEAFAAPELDALRDGEDAATLLSGDAPAEADVPEPPVEADGG
ncbi:MAG: hypothetical protein LBC72_02760, partial [Spirochaetaceae bacterium]|nr:hypothetical protein [Spirochaetaceae bacterium]